MAKNRILVIEDDVDVAELLLMFFNAEGYEVLHADTGSEGVSLARGKLPNLILLDIMLPDMDGFDVCKDLRSTNLTKYIPTLFLTQRNARADKVAGLQLGADDYITKPFDIEELRLRVKGTIHRATRENLHERITGLPTGPLVDEVYEHFRRQNRPWQRLDITIQGFDAFRDAYGFITANDALNLAAKVLQDGIVQAGTQDDFVGTSANAHFVIFTYAENVAGLKELISADFAERARSLYRYMDADQGYIVIDEGTELEKHVGLMTFDISVQDTVSSSG